MALLVTLFLIAILSLMLVALVSRTSLDHQASANYTKSLGAEQIGIAGLEMVISQLRQEMSKDQLPDLTYPAKPLYTNVTAANLSPQALGTNSAMPLLVKISTNAPFFTGTRTKGTLVASTISTATASLNGRSLGITRWNDPYLGTFPSTKALPSWVIVTRGGPSDGTKALFGPAGETINNSAISNTNYAVGRFAYAVYDTSGLLDITIAGYPTNLVSAIQAVALKGTLAGADVSALGIDPKKLTTWRNAASAASATSYLTYVTNFASTNGFLSVANGDTTFLSRQDLIQAAQKGTAGLTTAALTNLTVFSRERNSPTWRPQNPPGITPSVNYTTLGTVATSTNVFPPLVRYTTTNTITSYRISGSGSSKYTYPVKAGDPLLYTRFPLDRIRWITSSGPAAGATDEAIQACFGLKWDTARGLWQYVGSTLPYASSPAEQSSIKTLAQVAAETKPREANFFELLQAGILTGSLGSELHLTPPLTGSVNGFNANTFHESSSLLHIFRIGASILTQYQPDACPVVVEYVQPSIKIGSTTYPAAGKSLIPWQASGIANLPYLNMMTVLGGTSPDNAANMAIYMVFGLWNPHQGTGTVTSTNRPPIRLRSIGTVSVCDFYGGFSPGGYSTVPQSTSVNAGAIPGYTHTLNTTNLLSTAGANGVNGFVDPHAIAPNDMSVSAPVSTPAGSSWATFMAPGNVTYGGYRLPDFKLSATYASSNFWTNSLTISGSGTSAITNSSYTSSMNFWANNDPVNNPFNVWLEYQNPKGVWVPYNYLNGINDTNTWMAKTPGFTFAGLGRLNPSNSIATPVSISETTATDPGNNYYYKCFWEVPDPRSLRYNYTQSQSAGTSVWPTHLNGSYWSSSTDSASQTLGWIGAQIAQIYFGPSWVPASLARNNNQANFVRAVATSAAAYKDPDGVARIADSGLFGLTTPATANNWAGDPYASSSLVVQRGVSDRPVILNRPFASVGELGYVNRDYPWRTLDLFTTNSADAGLLDLFTVSQSSDSVARGRVNPNRAPAPVIEAILRGTISGVATTNALSKPSTIAGSLTNFTATAANTLLGRDQIATRFVAGLNAANFATTDEANVKALRESVTRSLADVAQTRTWNLLIDVTAQAGRYPPTATRLDQFQVEGEHRFWLHIAIDRYTGEIIDQQIERVSQ
ncbi:hypothetical protein SAMN05444156_0427 [Verrucomicrobium sp. GAS474]|nr:hypothetical protein SAMN05444156_0427 [Verrucomicrobium sp. GAS474]